MASFYKDVVTNFYKNSFYAFNIALEEYLAKAILNNEINRVVYSSTDYALIKRFGQNPWNNANLPFVNYKLENKAFGGSRPWFNYTLFSQGLYVPEIGEKIKMIPITMSYDMTYWTGRDDDWQFAYDTLILDGASETKLKYYLDFNGVQISNIAIISFNLDGSIKFSEHDWLEKNDIRVFSLNPTVQTYALFTNRYGFCIPKTLLIEYLVKKDLLPAGSGETTSYEQLYKFTIDHMQQTVTLIE